MRDRTESFNEQIAQFRVVGEISSILAAQLGFLQSVAVGTALASGPPHGSVREEFPHTALTSGADDQPLLGTQLVVRATTPVTRFPGSVSGTSALVVRSPWSPSFPLRTPLPTLPRRLCSPASLVL